MRLATVTAWLILPALALVLACNGSAPEPAADGSQADDAHADAAASFQMESATVLHHWQALAAIRAGELDDARHHVEHIVAAVGADEAHASAMNEVLTQLAAGELHDAEHGIEGMLAGRAEPGIDPAFVHLLMALDGLESGAGGDAAHHIQHFVALSSSDSAHEAEEIIELVEAGDLDEASAQLARLVSESSAELAGEARVDDHQADADDDDARTVTVVMTEFAYDPLEIHAAVGERVRLVLVNEGAILHDITAEGFRGEAESAASVEHDVSEGGHHGGAFHAAVNAGDTVELVFVAEERGELELFCSVPGHRELGMTVRLMIE